MAEKLETCDVEMLVTFRSDFTKKPQSSKYGQFQNHNFGHVIKRTNHTHKSKIISSYSSKHNFKKRNPGETYLENVSHSSWPDFLQSLVVASPTAIKRGECRTVRVVQQVFH